MTAPSQMFRHALSALHGWPRDYALDYAAPLASGQTASRAVAGRCVSIDSSAKFIMGCDNKSMPMFLVNGANSFDVNNSGVDADGNREWAGVNPPDSGGNLTALVATGAFELETTEFIDDDNLLPGTYLTAHNTDDSDQGKLKYYSGQAYGATSVVGVQSRVRGKNSYKVETLCFWPVFLPSAS